MYEKFQFFSLSAKQKKIRFVVSALVFVTCWSHWSSSPPISALNNSNSILLSIIHFFSFALVFTSFWYDILYWLMYDNEAEDEKDGKKTTLYGLVVPWHVLFVASHRCLPFMVFKSIQEVRLKCRSVLEKYIMITWY